MKMKDPYWKDFDWKVSVKFFVIVLILFFCRRFVNIGIAKYIIQPFHINEIEASDDLDILATLLILFCVGRIVFLVFWKKQKPTLNTCVNVFLVTVWYCAVIRVSGNFELVPLSYLKEVKYLDIFFLTTVVSLLRFKYYCKERSTYSIDGFIEDDYHPEHNVDILNRKKFAWQIGFKILSTKRLKKAFVIAINSPWGFGKSGFLLLLEDFFKTSELAIFKATSSKVHARYSEEQLKELFVNSRDVIVVRYNPWKNFDEKKTIKDFFDEMSESVRKYDYNLSRKVKKYSSYLNKLDDSVFRKIIETAIDAFAEDETLTDLFEEINKAINRIGKRIVVFIDDLDRLNGDELIEMVKLIRNTANFENTIFILAYDHNYVLNTINKRKLISNKEEYLQKIVQLEITLPIYQKNILLQFLDDQLKRDWNETQIQMIKPAMDEIISIVGTTMPPPGTGQNNPGQLIDFFSIAEDRNENLIFNLLQNIRDVVRFINSFKLSFEAIGNVGDLYEVILLELLKIKFLSVFQLVANKRFLFLKDGKYEFNYDEFDQHVTDTSVKLINIKRTDIQTLRRLLEAIFSPNRKVFFRSVKYPRYFDIYFSYQTPDIASLDKIEQALKNGIEEIIKVIDESVQENTFDDLRNFINSQDEYSTKEDFEIFLKTLFYVSKYDNK